VSIYHWNSVTKKRSLLGAALWKNSAKETTWTLANMPINYNPDSIHVMPDTILIVYSACSVYSKAIPKIGDTLCIDAASVVLGVDNVSADRDNVNIYPNPASEQINLAVTGQFRAKTVEVYDITGKLMGAYTIRNNFVTINTQSYSSGMYFYKLFDNTGAQLNVGKFSVVK
jgi:hypothetical protein